MKPALRILVWSLAMISFMLAVAIYAFWREPNIFLSYAFEFFDIDDTFLYGQNVLALIDIPSWVLYQLPDMLWMLSFTLAILAVWDFRISMGSKIWMTIAILSGILLECAQYWSLVPGTFDPLDLGFIFLGALPFFLLFINQYHEQIKSESY